MNVYEMWQFVALKKKSRPLCIPECGWLQYSTMLSSLTALHSSIQCWRDSWDSDIRAKARHIYEGSKIDMKKKSSFTMEMLKQHIKRAWEGAWLRVTHAPMTVQNFLWNRERWEQNLCLFLTQSTSFSCFITTRQKPQILATIQLRHHYSHIHDKY